MASATVTYSGSFGPGIALTSKVFTNVSNIEYDFEHSVIFITSNNKIIDVSMIGVATVTHTISGLVSTITIS